MAVVPRTIAPAGWLGYNACTGVTVTVADALCPSLVAVIVAVPTPCAVTTPPALTLATAAALVAHVTTLPVSTFPAASRSVAVSWPACGIGKLKLAGLTVTDATGTVVTVIDAVAVALSHAAAMIAVPAASAVTSPVPFTVATLPLLLAHVTTRPVKTFPFASLGVALSWTVCPTTILAVAGVTVTEATGTLFTVTAAVPLLPSLLAVIVA